MRLVCDITYCRGGDLNHLAVKELEDVLKDKTFLEDVLKDKT